MAYLQFKLLNKNPYMFTSDDVLFQVFATRNNLTKGELKQARKQFFLKGQPCFRTSPLTKRYGWGVHSDKDGKIALIGCDTPEYKRLLNDKNLKTFKAMRSGK